MPTSDAKPIKLVINGVETTPGTKAKLRDIGKTLDEVARAHEEREAARPKEEES